METFRRSLLESFQRRLTEQLRDSLRVEIFGPELITRTLCELGIELPVIGPEIVQKSSSDIQTEKVLGILEG